MVPTSCHANIFYGFATELLTFSLWRNTNMSSPMEVAHQQTRKQYVAWMDRASGWFGHFFREEFTKFKRAFAWFWQGWAGIPVPDHFREYGPPIPVPKVWEWVFHSRSRSQKLGMLFSIPVPVPKIRECNFPFPFPLAGMDYNVGNKMGMEFKSWE